MKVKCSNSDNGCEWIRPLDTVSDHVTKSCDFTLVTCKYEDIGCKEKCTQKCMREHDEDTSFHLSLSMDAVKKLTQLKRTMTPDDLTIKMTNFTEKKENNESFFSEPFYTHPNGYKLCLCVWPNGTKNGNNAHLAAGVQFLKGPYDDSLSWPFEGSITLQLLNQISDEDHCSNKVDINSDDNCNPTHTKFLC